MAETVKYTVVKGDSLYKIAKEQLGDASKWPEIAELNGIKSKNGKYYIYPGQVLVLSGDPVKTPVNNKYQPRIDMFGLQSDIENEPNTLFATWTFSLDNVDHYEVLWTYDTGDGVWFTGNKGNVDADETISTYSIPSNAKVVKFKVLPVSKTKTVEKKSGGTNIAGLITVGETTTQVEVAYWKGQWSQEKTYDVTEKPPVKPSTPSAEITDNKLLTTLDNLDLNATVIHFQVVQVVTEGVTSPEVNVAKESYTTIDYATKEDEEALKNGYARFTCYLNNGGEYKVRARSNRGSLYSDWSDYSNSVFTIPATTAITELKTKSETSVYLAWNQVVSADTYDISYATKLEYFDGSDQEKTVSSIEFTHYEISGVETGETYHFRVRAVNEAGPGEWSEIESIPVGKNPAAPTTWSSTTTAVTGEPLNLYWIHNSEDGASQTYAEVDLIIDGVGEVRTVENSKEEDEKDKTSVYPIDTSVYTEGTQILWRVRTAGLLGGDLGYGDWSVQRTIYVYAPPSLDLTVTNSNGEALANKLESFPFYIKALAGPNTQAPVSYHIDIISNEFYETVDEIGNRKTVSQGESVYSKHFDISSVLLVEMSAGNINLENNVTYTIICTVSMNSGLTAESRYNFQVYWDEQGYQPNSEIGIDYDTLSALIKPYCVDENGNLIEDISLSVYRREYDGTFTEIIKGVDNVRRTLVVDPHPALDYARYRIVATTNSTGAVQYYDPPGYPVLQPGIVIQWDETYTNFDIEGDILPNQPMWSGSIIKLPYNVDVSPSYSQDVSLVDYIGRKNPVGYYGTKIGEGGSWNADISKSDKDTLFMLRRLSIWMGDVYVRESSGVGYWANVKVTFPQKHLELTIPVSLDIKRVEGGM